MPAQIIVLGADDAGSVSEPKGSGDQPKDTKPADDPKDPPPKYPKWRPINITSVVVVGQAPHPLGHFDNMTALAEAARGEKLPGGSNTVFATVKSIKDLSSEAFHQSLGKLPDQLTIVVQPSDPDAR